MPGKLVILDRDGVINFDSPDYIKSPEEWTPIPGSIEAIARLNQHGYRIFVATNQAGIARGKLTLSDLHAIHQKLLDAVTAAGGAIAGIEYCPHHPDDHCDCRKPAPGMLLAIERAAGTPIQG
ncbi:MAG TPA: HAD-IIIA family hydrolase, partial [Pseudomonadales bacterium]|nr:HAD-IIIA family hydrolase [Pseudomonadales bacterium]